MENPKSIFFKPEHPTPATASSCRNSPHCIYGLQLGLGPPYSPRSALRVTRNRTRSAKARQDHRPRSSLVGRGNGLAPQNGLNYRLQYTDCTRLTFHRMDVITHTSSSLSEPSWSELGRHRLLCSPWRAWLPIFGAPLQDQSSSMCPSPTFFILFISFSYG